MFSCFSENDSKIERKTVVAKLQKHLFVILKSRKRNSYGKSNVVWIKLVLLRSSTLFVFSELLFVTIFPLGYCIHM